MDSDAIRAGLLCAHLVTDNYVKLERQRDDLRARIKALEADMAKIMATAVDAFEGEYRIVAKRQERGRTPVYPNKPSAKKPFPAKNTPEGRRIRGLSAES